MKHLRKGRKFSRKKKPREAMLKIMLGALLLNGRMKTTEAKAKELKGITDKIIGKIKKITADGKDGISEIKKIRAALPANVDTKTLKEMAKKNASRTSGFVRLIKLAPRKSDSAKMAIIEIIER